MGTRATVGLVVLFLMAAGCEATPEKIARWKETERGPAKLREVVRGSSKPALRAQALVALVEIGMTAEGLRELQAAPEAGRAAVVDDAVGRLVELAGHKPGRDTTRAEREAKDALFELRPLASPTAKESIDKALVAWTTADLSGRWEQGGHGTQAVLEAVGAPAVPRLLEIAGQPGTGPGAAEDRQRAALLVGKIGSEADRARVADALVESARTRLLRTRDVDEATLTALGSLGGPKARALLVEIGESGPAALRDKALLALAKGGRLESDPATLTAALRLATDKKAPPKVRDAAFEVVDKSGPQAVPKLVPLLNDGDELVRWRAVEAALEAGGPAAIEPVLEGLAPSRTYEKDDLQSYVLRDMVAMGAAAVAPFKKELGSKSWVARLVAIWGLGKVGTPADASALAALTGDDTKLKGLRDQAAAHSLGAEAKAAMTALSQKK